MLGSKSTAVLAVSTVVGRDCPEEPLVSAVVVCMKEAPHANLQGRFTICESVLLV
jgi:hypothetical protein